MSNSHLQLSPLLRLRTQASIDVLGKCQAVSLLKYRDDPLGYMTEVLKITPTDDIRRACEALLCPPRRLLIGSGHSVGKTMFLACLACWFYDTRPDGIVLTTAPTERQVVDLLWKEVRVLRRRAGLKDEFTGPKIPRLESGPDHYAYGFTARDTHAFHGKHAKGGVMILFDEADGIDADFWEAAPSMLDDNSFFVACYNPLSVGSAAHQAEYKADSNGTFRRINISCVDHPNIKAALEGKPLPIPGAITLKQLEAMLLEDSMVLSPGDEAKPGDVELNGKRYRPGPVAEARCLGRRPSTAIASIWFDELWQRVLDTRHDIQPEWPVVIGCDVARYGDDQTVIMVRKGMCLLHVETHVKQSTTFTATRLKELCWQYKDADNDEFKIPCMIDEGGIGGGVIDQCDRYTFHPVNAACKPRREERYINVRAELWFVARDYANLGAIDLSRLPPAYTTRLKQELMAGQYLIQPRTGRIQVTPKDDMKAVLGRSPDLADAFNLAFYPPA